MSIGVLSPLAPRHTVWRGAGGFFSGALTLLAGTALLLSGCAANKSRLKIGQTDQGEVVEAEGLAPYEANDLIKTKRGSLTDAQRNAVEKAVGVFVSAKTMVEQAIAIENNILARTEGYVKKYDILSETVDQGLYKTKIRALVAIKDLEADLKGMSLLKAPPLKRPRVSVLVSEEVDKKTISERPAASALEKSLIDSGYVVVGQDRLKEAEVNITGRASAYPFQTDGLGGFVSYRARLSIQATRPGSSDVVLSLSKEASGLGGNAELAGFKSLETVGNLVGEETSAQLADNLAKAGTVLVYVQGVGSFSDVDRVKKHLVSQPVIADLMFRSYDEKTAQFEVQLKNGADAMELASALSASKTLPLKIIESKAHTMMLQLE